MKVKIICLGSIKEKYLKLGIDEYLKRLSRYANVNIIELNEYKINDNPSESDINNALKIEATNIKKYIDERDYLIVLDVDGKNYNNIDMVNVFNKQLHNHSCFTFVIGSSHGLSDEIKKLAHLRWSFSNLVFTHQMIRLMLLEQVYRTFKIIKNEPYHK